MKLLLIIAICTAAAVLYGIAHDQATVRLCSEYFSVFHRDIGVKSPTLVGLYWGASATWWFGLGLGVVVAVVSRFGRGPKVEPREILIPVLYLLLFTGAVSILAGIAGALAASNGYVHVTGEMSTQIPPGRHVAFITNLWSHIASYGAGAVGGVFLAGWITGRRGEAGRMMAAT